LTPRAFAFLIEGMNGKKNLLLGVLALAIASSAQAALSWDKTELELKPAIGAATAVGVFKYANKGDKPIPFNAVRPSCGCTTAALAKNDVAPGEKGEITATLNIGERTGLQTKTITVETDDPTTPSTVLTLKAMIAQVIELEPGFVVWEANEPAKPKTIVAKASKEVTVKNIEVTSSSADFTAKVEPGSAPGEFKINVLPKDTAKPINATLTVKPDAATTPAKVYYVQARINPPGTATVKP
jgi:hypothetical protein